MGNYSITPNISEGLNPVPSPSPPDTDHFKGDRKRKL
ncbi:hypothetical protein, unlikely [Trypanosoma brucei brucei TREU927]|uniref:Uncharacterized protein n=1 Tax=Trypanosoma brucei brucei (strain 927/4 GUTat10.1) TaxID=185431 RepID=Q38FK2_TRYB2|nr:hypothetical protein, unlikely [Trypanosoma brucei brucei TREU927]EAN76418.1 hypothetical protein, unlikely [Trypanosoma brucei brucei TREU927]